jgi:hypothetical protein
LVRNARSATIEMPTSIPLINVLAKTRRRIAGDANFGGRTKENEINVHQLKCIPIILRDRPVADAILAFATIIGAIAGFLVRTRGYVACMATAAIYGLGITIGQRNH